MTMKRLIVLATLLLASSAAQAGDSYTFEVGGHTIHIDAPSGCNSPACVSISIPGIYESDPKRAKRARATPQTDPRAKAEPQIRTNPKTKVEPQPAPAATIEQPQPSNATPPSPAATAAPANPAPALPGVSEPAPASTPPAPAPAARPVVASAPVSGPVQQQQAPAPAASRPAASPLGTPLGTWQTEEKEGLVRIEACGSNLCGYSVDAKTNQNAEKILINMRPVSDTKWSGRIHDPKSDSNYDSTIALKGPDSLRVQGCAFGGLFCGGQTWSRVN
jgi:uncharacterized protein (DUF2147 family)